MHTTEWLVHRPIEAIAFPVVRHRHANGTLDAVRDRTPDVEQQPDGRLLERWTYACACGEVWILERMRG